MKKNYDSGRGVAAVDHEVADRDEVSAAQSILDFADRDPFAYYDDLRENFGSPVWDRKSKSWVITDFAQCVEIESDLDNFGNIYMSADPILFELKGGRANVTVSQGEEHDKLRKFHLALLAAKAVRGYSEKHITNIVDFVIDRFVSKGKVDLRAEFSEQVVPRVMLSLMNMPWQDDDLVQRVLDLNERIVAFIANNYRGEELKRTALAASHELNNMLLPYIRERRDNPDEDFISRVWTEASQEYGELTEEDVVAICRELYFAASDTTVHASSNALYLFLSDETFREHAYADREKGVRDLIEESLRLYSTVQMRHRLARKDSVINGKEIKKGDLLLLVHAAANRDPAQYECPHSAKLGRPRAAAHLAFGRGPRSCLGSPLARYEMSVMLNKIMDRLPNVRLDKDAQPPVFSFLYMRSFKPLNVVWDI